MISRKKRTKYIQAARQIAAEKDIPLDIFSWEAIWNILDEYSLPTYVYIIGEANATQIKIGKSTAPGQRLKTLQTSYPNKLYLFAYCKETDEINEKGLHQKFKHLNINGEWFQYTDELKQLTSDIKQMANV